MLDSELTHREVSWIAGREPTAERERSRCYEAIRLGKCAAAAGELAPPLPGPPAFHHAQRDDSKAGKERLSRLVLTRPESPNGLLDVDRARAGRITCAAERQ